MNVLLIGGSRNIGYFTAQRLLQEGATVTFLLRKPKCFDADVSIRPFVDSGKARLVQGDALKEDDVRNAWTVAAEGNKKVDTVLFTLGGSASVSFTKGLFIDPPDLCTRCMLNVISTCPADQLSPSPPRLVLVSSLGVGSASHATVPLLLKPLHGAILRTPHADKLGLECVAAHASGRKLGLAPGDTPSEKILAPGWEARGGARGAFARVLVVRPALLTDGECRAETRGAGAYRVAEALSSAYTVSRKDVAHFIAEQALKDWDKWEGKCVSIAY